MIAWCQSRPAGITQKIGWRRIVDDFFAWLKHLMTSGTVLPKRKTASGINYCLGHESRLRVFLENRNGLNVYRYMEYLLTELPKLADDKGNIDTEKLDPLLPWSDQLPAQCQNSPPLTKNQRRFSTSK